MKQIKYFLLNVSNSAHPQPPVMQSLDAVFLQGWHAFFYRILSLLGLFSSSLPTGGSVKL
jgi:hypothetical protein